MEQTASPPQCYSSPHHQGGPAKAGAMIRSVGSVIRLSVPRHYKIMPQSNLCLKCLFPLRYVLFLLYISCQFLFLIDISPCCLLITRVTDWTAGTTKCAESRILSQAQKEWKTGLFRFKKKKKSSQSEAHVTGGADKCNMGVLHMGPKRFRGLSQCCTCFLCLLSNFTFSEEKGACLSFPDTEMHEPSPPTEKEEKQGSGDHSTPKVSPAPPEEHLEFIGHPFWFASSLMYYF